MNWNSQTPKIADKISRLLDAMNRIKPHLPFPAIKLIHDSLILSHRQFGITNWAFETGTYIKTTKTGPSDDNNHFYNAHTKLLFKYVHLLTVKDLFDIQYLKFWYKSKNGSFQIIFRIS